MLLKALLLMSLKKEIITFEVTLMTKSHEIITSNDRHSG